MAPVTELYLVGPFGVSTHWGGSDGPSCGGFLGGGNLLVFSSFFGVGQFFWGIG